MSEPGGGLTIPGMLELCTVICTVAGVGSASPSASVTVYVTVNTPAVLNVLLPGSSAVELAIPEPAPKFHR